MRRRLLSLSEVSQALIDPNAVRAIAIRSPSLSLGAGEGRCISFILSDESVARDNHTISTAGWKLDNYRLNPVVLLSHDDSTPPIARTVEIGPVGSQLRAVAEFPEADVYPLGDTIFRMLKGGFINAASVGWLPIEWRAAKDKTRPGGMDFISQELLEWSIVSVPSLPTAIATARSSGLEVKPLFDWAERLLDQGDFAVIGKPELETLRKAARMPPKPAPAPNPEPAPEPAPAAAAAAKPDLAALARVFKQRDLCTLGDLAYYLNSIEYLYDRVAAEAVREDDGSALPAKLRAWIDDGNRLLLEMAGEETQEQIDGTQDDPPSSYYWSAATLEAALARALDARGFVRKGAKYSAETLRCMRAIHGHLKKAHEQLSSLLDDAGDDADPEDNEDDPGVDPDDEDSRAARIARAEALRAKLKG